MKISCWHVVACAVLLIGVVPSQVLGQTPFGSFGGGPFDIVNLGNLNVRFAVPIVEKAGRGGPFIYNIAYDNNVWSPGSVSGVPTWKPVANYGWNFAAPNYAFGSLSFQIVTSWTQPCDPLHNNFNPVYVEVYGFFSYRDIKGAVHPFSFQTSNYTLGNACPAVNAPPNSLSGIATDGSGYTLHATGSSGTIADR